MLRRDSLTTFGLCLLALLTFGCSSSPDEPPERWSDVACANELNAVDAGKTVSREEGSLPTPCSAWVDMQKYSFTFVKLDEHTRMKGPAKPLFGWAKIGVDCPVKACGAKPLQNQISHVAKWEIVEDSPLDIHYRGEDSRGFYQHIEIHPETGLPLMVATSKTKTTDDILYFVEYREFVQEP